MARLAFLDVSLSIFSIFNLIIISVPLQSQAIPSSYGGCRDLNDCEGKLICINGRCNDDPAIGTHICRRTPAPGGGGGGSGSCKQYGTLTCGGKTYPTYRCSPPVTSSTPAKLTNNDFSAGWDGGGASSCDWKYHSNKERIVALSTGWFDNGSMCGKMIKITAKNGRSVKAKVVDECDSMRGCDGEHAYQPPCRNNIVDGSDAVWSALGLDKNEGVVEVTWSMAWDWSWL